MEAHVGLAKSIYCAVPYSCTFLHVPSCCFPFLVARSFVGFRLWRISQNGGPGYRVDFVCADEFSINLHIVFRST